MPKARPLSSYDPDVKPLLAQMTLDEKIGQMTQPDYSGIADQADIENYFLGSVLSGGSTDPREGNSVKAWTDLATTTTKHEPIKPEPSDTACFIYTSGTTGNPKGVILSHGNLASNVNAMQEIFPLSSMDRSLSFLPWAHVFGQTVELHGLFAGGASIALCESVDKLIDNLGETKPAQKLHPLH